MKAFQYNDLKDIDETEALTDGDYECLDEIRKVLIKRGKADKFGINLLHRHFDVADDECVVEYTDKENRKLVSVVKKKGEVPAVETMWRFDTDEAGMCFRKCFRSCVKWGSYHSTNHPQGVHEG